jgi:hypothetical protein
MKKEIPIWLGLLVCFLFGLSSILMAVFVDDKEIHRLLLGEGVFVALIALSGGASWSWYIYKGKLQIKDIEKSVEEIDREAEAALREAADLIERSKSNDTSKPK